MRWCLLRQYVHFVTLLHSSALWLAPVRWKHSFLRKHFSSFGDRVTLSQFANGWFGLSQYIYRLIFTSRWLAWKLFDWGALIGYLYGSFGGFHTIHFRNASKFFGHIHSCQWSMVRTKSPLIPSSLFRVFLTYPLASLTCTVSRDTTFEHSFS